MLKKERMLMPVRPSLRCFPLIMRAICILFPSNMDIQRYLFEPLPEELAKAYARVESTLSRFYGRSVGTFKMHPGYRTTYPELGGTVHAFDFIVRNTSQPAAALVLRGGGASLYEAAYVRKLFEQFRRGDSLPFTIKHRLVREVLSLPARQRQCCSAVQR